MAAAQAQARGWLVEKALPLWAEHGVDAQGLFYETLDYAARPDIAGFRRVRVQARQLYVFAHAHSEGWFTLPRLEEATDAFIAHAFMPDGRPGWVHKLDARGQVLDAQRDAYDHAFALFALAHLHRATGDHLMLRLAEQTMAYMDEALAHPAGGYAESDPPALPRRSNPHMHLLEALLAWHRVTGERDFLERTDRILGLFETHFYDPATTTLGEYFTEDLRPAPGAPGQVVEPGHHFEWTWLLKQAAQAGARDLTGAASALYAFGLAHGIDAKGLAVDEVDRQGRIVRASRRSWPQAELIKAHTAMGDAPAAAAAWGALHGDYLTTQIPGLWIDQFDAHGQAMTPNVPASSLYHLQVAVDQLLRMTSDVQRSGEQH